MGRPRILSGVSVPAPPLRVAVVGHLEWIDFAVVDRIPRAGEIAHATDAWQEPGGGGGVAAVQLARLAGGCDLFTAVGDDAVGRRMVAELEGLGVRVHAALRDAPTRRAVSLLDGRGERTIVTLGARLEAHGADALPWETLAQVDAVYVTAGDPEALAAARTARLFVATPRALGEVIAAGTPPDALVGSALDVAEAVDPNALPWRVPLVVRTAGATGGSFTMADGGGGTYDAVAPPGPVVDSYGAGDAFAAGLTFALARGDAYEGALAFAARCGAAAATGRGSFAGQLRHPG